MKLKIIFIRVLVCIGLIGVVPAKADSFSRTGTITRTLTDQSYGGCMIHLSTVIGNGCPAAGWVSLDCDATYLPEGAGTRAYATALTAFSLGRTVFVIVNNAKKHNGYCVANRLDMY